MGFLRIFCYSTGVLRRKRGQPPPTLPWPATGGGFFLTILRLLPSRFRGDNLQVDIFTDIPPRPAAAPAFQQGLLAQHPLRGGQDRGLPARASIHPGFWDTELGGGDVPGNRRSRDFPTPPRGSRAFGGNFVF